MPVLQPVLVPLAVLFLLSSPLIIAGTFHSINAQETTPNMPELVNNPLKFQVKLFADFSQIEGLPKVFQLTVTNGTDGFPAGLYVTSGPTDDERSNRLFHIDKMGNVSVVSDGFRSNEALVFAHGEYGDGMLVTEPLQQRIVRLFPNGSMTTFAKVGTPPFGPADLTYGADNLLYVTDFSGNSTLRVYPNGTSEIFAPLAPEGGAGRPKGMIFDNKAVLPENFVVSTFTLSELVPPQGEGAIYTVSPDGKNVTKIVGGLDGAELMALGPGGSFGSGLFVASIGTDLTADGAVFVLYAEQDGVLRFTPFLRGVDATHVAFDNEGILGGGMFVADFADTPDNKEGRQAGRIWHIVPTEPSFQGQ
jgi:hypothetical protein